MLLASTWIFDRLSVELVGRRQSPDTVETDRSQTGNPPVGWFRFVGHNGMLP
jgi:hypothetical protein